MYFAREDVIISEWASRAMTAVIIALKFTILLIKELAH